MFLDLTLTTFFWALFVMLLNLGLWTRAATVESDKIARLEVAFFTIILLAFLVIAGSFLLVMKRSEIAVSLTAWAFLAGTILCAGATGLLYAKYDR